MKANVMRREFPSTTFHQTPEEKIGKLTGSLSTKINLQESSDGRHGNLDRTMYTTNSTWSRNRQRGQKHLKSLGQTTEQKRNDAERSSGDRLKQVFYWGHERNPPTPPITKIQSQQLLSHSKVQFDPQDHHHHHARLGKAPYSRQSKSYAQSQGGSCPTQIYSKFKSIHSGKMMNQTYQDVPFNGHIHMDHYPRRRPHLQPLMRGYAADKPRLENSSYYDTTESRKGPPSWKSDALPTSSAMSITGSHSNTWPLDVEDRQASRWSPLQNTFDTVPVEQRANSLSYEDRWDFVEWPAPPPNSITPSSLETSQPPPNTPYGW